MASRYLAWALLTVGLFCVPVACGFPDYGFQQPATGGGGGTASSGGGIGGMGGAAGAGGAGGSSGECATDDDCVGSPNGPVCDPLQAVCVVCLPSNDVCPTGQYCTTANECVVGCADDTDCQLGDNGGQPPPTCDLPTHTCVGCVVDDPCPPGTICDVPSTQCVPGCTPTHVCQKGADCCTGACVDLMEDEANCGACDVPCAPPSAVGECTGGMCQLASCLPGFGDCDLDPQNGCEADLATDPLHCGACGAPCAALPNASPGCSGGMCSLGPCLGGFADCDLSPANGCEVDTQTSASNCSACGAVCVLANATATCMGGACAIGSCNASYLDCDQNPANGCEIDTQTSVANCGACGAACNLPNAAPACSAGMCTIAMCAIPFADCNASAMDGCETNLNTSAQNCGMCGTVCSLPNATAACSNGGCVVASCNAGFADCDGSPVNGCEVNINTSVLHCGGCGAACSTNNATPSCSGGTCSVSCDAGFENCDGNVANGCEINTVVNVQNCGACGNVCPPQGGTPACVASQCTVSMCAAGFGDCDGNGGNGCETTTTNDPQNCGGCGIACFAANGTAACTASNCYIASCNAGFADCNGQYADGCETNLNTLANCGSCGTICDLPNAVDTCATGSCQIASCSGTFSNCDGITANGCEVDTAANVSNCGSCGNVCSSNNGAPSCTGGSCSIQCAAGYGNCDASVTNGCETPTTNNVNACGGCGIVCTVQNGTPACSGTQCTVASCTAPYEDCDGQYANGCEANTSTSTANCGTCGTQCTNANGTTSCAGGTCSPMCNMGYQSCDGNVNNGCETSTTTVSDCGGCGVVCNYANASETCPGGACTFGACDAGFGDCNGMLGDGCETSLTTTANCGICGTTCTNPNGTTSCSGGMCAPLCAPGYKSCDGNPDNGCETSIYSLSSCGDCGIVCDYANASETCPGGTCTLGPCDPGFGNCDGNASNGCEIDTTSNNLHCGGCNNPCAGGLICVNSTCVSSCPAGTADCDMNMANGCEVNTLTDGNHCGGCSTVCTGSQYCNNGTCVACSAGTADCDKDGGNGCEVNTATSPANCGGCGISCGSDSTCGCSAGMCSGGTIYLSEDFSDNSRGWMLDTEWGIAPAMTSSGQDEGFSDPSADYSITADNGVAGIVIGGNYLNTPDHGFYYLTSPVINLSGAAGTAKLTYWRWLNADYYPYTEQTVEVYDGSSWVVLWTSQSVGSTLITDSAWSKFEFDVTTYKNAGFRVRFGHAVGSSFPFVAFTMSGWNIDDLTVSSATCN